MVGYQGIRGCRTDQTLEFCRLQEQPFEKQVGGADADSTVCGLFGVASGAGSVSLAGLVALAARVHVGYAVLLSGNSLAVLLLMLLLDVEGPQEQTVQWIAGAGAESRDQPPSCSKSSHEVDLQGFHRQEAPGFDDYPTSLWQPGAQSLPCLTGVTFGLVGPKVMIDKMIVNVSRTMPLGRLKTSSCL
jgi:hypothetical protein